MSCMDVDDPQERPIEGPRGRTFGRGVNWRPLHPTVVQGLNVSRTTSVGTTEKNGRRRWHVVRNTERIAR